MTDKLKELETRLNKKISGEIRFESGDRALYATDSSNYRQVPLGVVLPNSQEDIIETVKLCREFDVPILSRGGGTSLAGQTCNAAVIMDMSKYYNRLLELNPEKKWAIIEPGLVLDNLRTEAEKHHLTFGPDPATHNRCTLGGMMGNNSCGVHSIIGGRTSENVIELEILTPQGLKLTVGETSDEELTRIIAENSPRSSIYLALKNLRFRYEKLIREKYPQIPRRVSGYNLTALLPENKFNVAQALVGTEGTCVTILSAKVRLIHSPHRRGIALIGFEDIVTAARYVPELMSHGPIGLEAIDNIIVENMRLKHLQEKDLKMLPKGNSWLVCEVGTDDPQETRAKLQEIQQKFKNRPGILDSRIFDTPEDQEHIWKIRESGLGATAEVPGMEPTWEGWEDSAVPPEKLADYLTDLKSLYDKYGFRAALYGHFGQGCVHTRINFDFFTAPGVKAFKSFLYEAADLVVHYGGSISGEHGDGQSKAELLSKMYGPELITAFAEFKSIWDPRGLMNPGKMVRPFGVTENLRLGPKYAPITQPTHFSFVSDNGSMAKAALRCVGVGLCRRQNSGVMCPSYMVTREEKHSTRGRARLLWEVMNGDVLKDGLKNEELHEALDLCLSCKGCKSECPVNVDMATYKAEFLAHYYKGKIRPASAYSMGLIGTTARLGTRIPGLTNFLMHGRGISALAKKIGGIHPAREIPSFAPENFRTVFQKTPKRKTHGNRPVILWTDTFNTYFHPQVASAAHRVLEHAGFDVSIPKKPFCCGRPLYDFGFLEMAKKRLRKILTEMKAEIRAGIPVVVLEPSCASVFADEMTNLFPDDMDALRLKKQTFLLSDFLDKEAADFDWPSFKRKAVVQGHCHHRSTFGMTAEEKIFKKLNLDAEVLDSGCCGMAGAFGFEKSHYDVSLAAGDRVLIPKIRATPNDVLVIANGFSCREQITQATNRSVYHLAEVLDQALTLKNETKKRGYDIPGPFPEPPAVVSDRMM